MVAPLAPYPAAGVIWYQGESNAGKPDVYPKVMAALIADWRKRWADPALPFLIVQLPAFVDPKFVWVREAQAKMVADTPRTALVVALDTADGFDLHPKTKREIGWRLALQARRLVYGEKGLVTDGPTFKSAQFDGPTVRVTFDANDGATARGSNSQQAIFVPVNVKGFAVAGDDGVFRFADATVFRNIVEARCDAVPAPKAIRYAWAAVPDANLASWSGLPAAPFRTDAFPRESAEVLPQPTPRRVATPAYEVEVSGDGRVTSLGVGGQQFLSNALGGAGGTSVPGMFGPHGLPDVRPLGPNLLACADSDVTLELAFESDRMRWTLTNRGRGDTTLRIALSAGVTVAGGGPRPGGSLTLARGKSRLTIDGVDKVEATADGKLLSVTVKGGKSTRLDLAVVGGR